LAVRICPRAGLPVVLVLVASAVTVESAADDARRYVLAPTGLHLRERPDPGARTLGTMAYGTAVTLLDEARDDGMRVEGLTGGMARIEVNGVTGYVFDG